MLTFTYLESVVILPSLGIQLETHRGLAGHSLFAARRFIPWSSLEDFLINEGIRGWDIRYYLVAINRTPQDALQLEVAFEVSVVAYTMSPSRPHTDSYFFRTSCHGFPSFSRYIMPSKKLWQTKSNAAQVMFNSRF